MRIFNRSEEKVPATKMEKDVEIMDKPNIICFDMDSNSIKKLKDIGFKVSDGTLGTKINVPNTSSRSSKEVLLNYSFPPNMHEFDIIVLNLTKHDMEEYDEKEHTRMLHTGKTRRTLICSYPETLFDPRPYSASILRKALNGMGNKPFIVIAFCCQEYRVEYEMAKHDGVSWDSVGTESFSIMDFSDYVPWKERKFGREVNVCNINENMKSLLNSHTHQMTYHQTFDQPTRYEGNKSVKDEVFLPLLESGNGDIVSICELRESKGIFYFPMFKDPSEFLKDFISKICPAVYPDVFPFSKSFGWKDEANYWLPNHENLLGERKRIEEEFEIRMKEKDYEIETNKKEYAFLHDILTESGDELVTALISFFKWLGFGKVIDMDQEESESGVLEEDIQIPLVEGLLIIECKGIGGTSTDSDCMQVSKIKHRRCKARNSFDVKALYVVNHQRYLPPLNRKNPPFTENQMQDAVNDERGLLSTWQLYNLYFEVEEGIITREEARNSMLNYGLVEFKPEGLIYIDTPQEFYSNNHICIVNIDDTELKMNDMLFVEKNGRYSKAQITGIKLNDVDVQSAKSGELGLKLDTPIKKNSKLWIRQK